MNKFKFYFIVFTASVLFFSCTKDNNSANIEPPRDYTEQYPKDIAIIEDYLKSNYFTVINHSGFVDDQDVTIKKIDAGQPSIYSYLDSPTYPKLLVRPVKLHNVEYKLYYLVLRPGVGVSPCNVDGVLSSYRGTFLERSTATTTVPSEVTATFFEEDRIPQATMSLFSVIRGWKEIFPQFKTGTSTINNNGTVTHNDFGAGVMFIPSGLAYYNVGSSKIPSYSPLVFSFKLYNIERLDQDVDFRGGIQISAPDGVLSYQEDINGDGYIWTSSELPTNTINPDDTDNDGIPDFLDVDDDGDNYTTKLEITKPAGTNSGLSLYFPYDPIVDDPFTSAIETETKGIPSYDKESKTFDYTTPGRLRIHLDKTYSVIP
jgi:hypothetical protein